MNGKANTKNAPAAAARETDQLGECACFNLRKTARAITQAYDAELRQAGLRPTQFSLLATLHHHQPVSISRLAELMVMERTTMSRNLRPLEKEGLLRTERGEDARVHQVRLTPQGEHAFREGLPHWRKAQHMVRERLGSSRLNRILDDLSAVRATVGAE